ncbi:MAG: heme-binding protein [Dehalococcoidia bacterium]|nr:heme-binding protein [Dehalococcoidia bacterium]
MAAIDGMLASVRAQSLPPMALVIVDQYGDLMALACMDGVTPFMRDYATKKAYTAAHMGADLADFAARLKAQGGSVTEYADSMLVGASRGGLVVRVGAGLVVGGVGVSGGTPDQDDAIARVGVATLTGG